MKPAILLTLPLLLTTAFAAPTGRQIAEEEDRRDQGFHDTTVDAQMVLRNAQGQSSSRVFTLKTLEQQDDGDKSIIVFDSPRDVKGTALLTFIHTDQNDDQWLYLPALKRVKRISSSNKSGPFVGSEFAYEDIASQELDKYTYKYVGEGKANGLDCFIVERQPTYAKSGYSKQVAWIDKKEYRYQKVDFYDRKGSKLKTLTFTGYKQYLGKFWRAGKFAMVNHENGKSTDLVFKNWKFKSGLADKDFTQTALKRSR